METDTVEKIRKSFDSASNFALILPDRINADLLCSAIALQAFLVGKGKVADIFSSASVVPALGFLSMTPKIHSKFNNSKDLVIRVSGKKTKPSQLRYEKDGNDLLGHITPEEGVFSEADVEVIPQAENYELLIILGASRVEDLGSIYSSNTEKFYGTPKITINNNINQEYFSNITWVELEVSSLSEQLVSLIGQEELSKKNDLVITSLLAGIISSTGSFRDPKTTPESLNMAANLVKLGARQQDIIQYLFKTKPFSLLQLWGRALARIKIIDSTHLYTVVTKQDFEKTQTSTNSSVKVLEEIISMTGSYQLISLIVEGSNSTEVYLAAQPHIKLIRLAKNISPTFDGETQPLGSNYYYVHLDLGKSTTLEVEQIISSLKLTGI